MLPAALMIGGGLLSGIGMLGQASAGRRAQRQMNRLASGVQGQYGAALAPIGGLLTELQGQNVRQMAYEDARLAYGSPSLQADVEKYAGYKMSRGELANFQRIASVEQQARIGQAALGALSSRTQQNLAGRMGLAEILSQGQMRAADMMNQIRLGGIQTGLQNAQQTYGNISQLGAFALGAGVQAKMKNYLSGLDSVT